MWNAQIREQNETMMTNWTPIKTITDGEKYEINGINIWNHKWIDTEKKINLKDPLYGKKHNFDIYRIENSNVNIEFAVCEFSNCILGISEKVT